MGDAIVLAGGGAEPGLDPSVPNKGFLEVGGRPLLSYVVRAVRSAPRVRRVAVVGPPDAVRAAVADVVVVPEDGGIMDNVARATAVLGAHDPILVVASDIPLLTSAVVEDFLAACAKDSADFHYAIVPQQAMEQRFPGVHKTFVRVTEGTYCGGNVMLFNPAVVDRVRPFVERVVAARKKPWLLAQLFGWSIVMKFASGRLSIEEMEAKVTESLGIT
ncbi:MAG TPA: nucleotidyltransferase family protein, partial [bacterium]|nr:nucleotidyltransferase family protein [bacterium]